MQDLFDRNIDYLRISITDRCNLRCKYCMPEALADIPHDLILRYEEILRICAIMSKLGITTVKVTGGEPFVRRGCMDFIKRLKQIPGIEHITLTTNGTLLEGYIEALSALDIAGINISLDSLDTATYRLITGRDEMRSVWRSLHMAVEAGLKIKINCVPIKDLNDHEIIPIARLAEIFPIDVRFIELMPTGAKLEGISASEIIDVIQSEFADLSPDFSPRGFGPARYFKSGRLKGRIGVIDALSNHFCAACNRIRLTSEGFLKLCLQQHGGIDLRSLLRSGADDATIKDKIAAAVRNKPERHLLNEGELITKMSRIGG